MRRVLRGKRVCSCALATVFCFCASSCLFGVCCGGVLSVAIHHCVNAIIASGSPIRNPRCGTSKAEIALPQRHVVSGITVNEGGKIHQHAEEPAFVRTGFFKEQCPAHAAVQKNYQGRDDRCQRVAQHHERPAMDQADKASPRMKFSMNIDSRKSAPQRTNTAETKSEMKGVSESDAGVSWIFRWEVVSESETRDHAEVKWKIAEVV